MTLTTLERQQLDEVERRLKLDEPRLNRALSGMSCRPLRPARPRRGAARSGRWSSAIVTLVLGAGLTILITGAVMDLVAVMFVGAAPAQIGPVAAHPVLIRRTRPKRRSGSVTPAPGRS